VIHDSIPFKEGTMNGTCANHLCGFRFTKIVTKARYYHTHKESWVCTTCAQAINREWIATFYRGGVESRKTPPCISSEDALVLILQGNKITA